MSQLRPKLSPQFAFYNIGNGTSVVHHNKIGARFAVTQEETKLLQEMDGEKTLDELHELFRKDRGAFAFKDIQVLLFQLWSHGLLDNGEEIRNELFSEHEQAEFENFGKFCVHGFFHFRNF